MWSISRNAIASRDNDWWTEQPNEAAKAWSVKPTCFIEKARKGIAQPGVKCRGREYLRIIYGAEYTLPENLFACVLAALAASAL